MSTELLLRAYPDLRISYRGRSLLVTAVDGSMREGKQGLYERDTRILSTYRFFVHGLPPRFDSLSPVDAHSTLAYFLCPPFPEGQGPPDPLVEETGLQVVIRVARFVGRGLHEDLDLSNYGETPARLELSWELAADFADAVETRSGDRLQVAPVAGRWQVATDGRGELRFDYQHPRLSRGVIVHLTSKPQPAWNGEQGEGGVWAVRCVVDLAPRETRRICLSVSPVIDGLAHEPLSGCDSFSAVAEPQTRQQAVRQRARAAEGTKLVSANAVVQATWDRAVADLEALALGEGETAAERAVPMAGMPHYNAIWGRDALTAAGQALMVSPGRAEGALRLLARHLGTKDDDFYDEQPGRVPQQLRDDPLSLLGILPSLHDYGDYASPCAFLVLLGGHHFAVGDDGFTREMLEPAKRVLDWLDQRADLDGDGFLEYQTRSPKGMINQGWKDSGDGVVTAHGQVVRPPTATCELQGYWYAAKVLMAEVFLSLGPPSRAFELYRQAEELKRRFNERFWMPQERFIAFALDADKRQVKSIASNAGHCLATGIVDGRYAEAVARRLMAPDLFSGWGVRTLSADHPAYNPFKYHLGAVWPVENATTAFGMKRYGFDDECLAIAKGIFDAAALFEHHRLPEVFGGQPRDALHPHPGLYPDACAPQAWSASAVIWLIQSMLGLWSYAPLRTLVVEPRLPEWLPQVTLRDLQVGQARVSIRFRRERDGNTRYRVLERQGTIHVVRQPPPGSRTATVGTRIRELVETLLAA